MLGKARAAATFISPVPLPAPVRMRKEKAGKEIRSKKNTSACAALVPCHLDRCLETALKMFPSLEDSGNNYRDPAL
jgi:hypothetical protein